MIRFLAVATLAFVGACADFATPAELDRDQVLGLRVEPATLRPGERGMLSALLAGPDGPLELDGNWSCESSSATLERVDGASSLIVADNAAPGLIRLVAEFQTASKLLTATRTVEVALESRANPTIDSISVDGVAVIGETVTAVAGSSIELDLTGDFDTTAVGSVNWYSTAGEIEIYHRAQTTLEAAEATEGWLLVVGRDGAGGIAWKQHRMAIEAAP